MLASASRWTRTRSATAPRPGTTSSSAALEEMVNVDCGSYSPAGVNVIADLCERRFRDHGWEVERRAHEGTPGSATS